MLPLPIRAEASSEVARGIEQDITASISAHPAWLTEPARVNRVLEKEGFKTRLISNLPLELAIGMIFMELSRHRQREEAAVSLAKELRIQEQDALTLMRTIFEGRVNADVLLLGATDSNLERVRQELAPYEVAQNVLKDDEVNGDIVYQIALIASVYDVSPKKKSSIARALGINPTSFESQVRIAQRFSQQAQTLKNQGVLGFSGEKSNLRENALGDSTVDSADGTSQIGQTEEAHSDEVLGLVQQDMDRIQANLVGRDSSDVFETERILNYIGEKRRKAVTLLESVSNQSERAAVDANRQKVSLIVNSLSETEAMLRKSLKAPVPETLAQGKLVKSTDVLEFAQDAQQKIKFQIHAWKTSEKDSPEEFMARMSEEIGRIEASKTDEDEATQRLLNAIIADLRFELRGLEQTNHPEESDQTSGTSLLGRMRQGFSLASRGSTPEATMAQSEQIAQSIAREKQKTKRDEQPDAEEAVGILVRQANEELTALKRQFNSKANSASSQTRGLEDELNQYAKVYGARVDQIQNPDRLQSMETQRLTLLGYVREAEQMVILISEGEKQEDLREKAYFEAKRVLDRVNDEYQELTKQTNILPDDIPSLEGIAAKVRKLGNEHAQLAVSLRNPTQDARIGDMQNRVKLMSRDLVNRVSKIEAVIEQRRNAKDSQDRLETQVDEAIASLRRELRQLDSRFETIDVEGPESLERLMTRLKTMKSYYREQYEQLPAQGSLRIATSRAELKEMMNLLTAREQAVLRRLNSGKEKESRRTEEERYAEELFVKIDAELTALRTEAASSDSLSPVALGDLVSRVATKKANFLEAFSDLANTTGSPIVMRMEENLANMLEQVGMLEFNMKQSADARNQEALAAETRELGLLAELSLEYQGVVQGWKQAAQFVDYERVDASVNTFMDNAKRIGSRLEGQDSRGQVADWLDETHKIQEQARRKKDDLVNAQAIESARSLLQEVNAFAQEVREAAPTAVKDPAEANALTGTIRNQIDRFLSSIDRLPKDRDNAQAYALREDVLEKVRLLQGQSSELRAESDRLATEQHKALRAATRLKENRQGQLRGKLEEANSVEPTTEGLSRLAETHERVAAEWKREAAQLFNPLESSEIEGLRRSLENFALQLEQEAGRLRNESWQLVARREETRAQAVYERYQAESRRISSLRARLPHMSPVEIEAVREPVRVQQEQLANAFNGIANTSGSAKIEQMLAEMAAMTDEMQNVTTEIEAAIRTARRKEFVQSEVAAAKILSEQIWNELLAFDSLRKELPYQSSRDLRYWQKGFLARKGNFEKSLRTLPNESAADEVVELHQQITQMLDKLNKNEAYVTQTLDAALDRERRRAVEETEAKEIYVSVKREWESISSIRRQLQTSADPSGARQLLVDLATRAERLQPLVSGLRNTSESDQVKSYQKMITNFIGEIGRFQDEGARLIEGIKARQAERSAEIAAAEAVEQNVMGVIDRLSRATEGIEAKSSMEIGELIQSLQQRATLLKQDYDAIVDRTKSARVQKIKQNISTMLNDLAGAISKLEAALRETVAAEKRTREVTVARDFEAKVSAEVDAARNKLERFEALESTQAEQVLAAYQTRLNELQREIEALPNSFAAADVETVRETARVKLTTLSEFKNQMTDLLGRIRTREQLGAAEEAAAKAVLEKVTDEARHVDFLREQVTGKDSQEVGAVLRNFRVRAEQHRLERNNLINNSGLDRVAQLIKEVAKLLRADFS